MLSSIMLMIFRQGILVTSRVKLLCVLDTYKYSLYYVLMYVVFRINYFNNLNFSIMCVLALT